MEFRGAWEKPEGRPGGIESCWPSSCSSLAPLELHQTSSKRDLPRGPCTLQAVGGSLWDFYTPPRPPRQTEKMASLAVPNSAANIHLEDGRTPESLSSAGFVPFLGHFVAIFAQFVCNFWTILKTRFRCFFAIFRRILSHF